MTFALDHVFVLCSAGATAEAEALAARGIKEGPGNTHPGQGTACRRFFFANAYLELVWVSDPEEAQGEQARPTRLWERWSGREASACPFAIVGRPADPARAVEAPFPTWPYRPIYLPPELAIDIALDTPLAEPEWFWLGFARASPRERGSPVDHALPLGDVRQVRIAGPVRPTSAAARTVEATGLVSFSRAAHWLMELVFEGPGTGAADLRPSLPLLLRW